MKTLHLAGEVDENMYLAVAKYLDYAVPERVLLNTQGGDFYCGLAIYDLLLPLNLTIFATGACMSSGVIIFCAGEKRLATPNTQFMIHYGQDSNETSTEAYHNREMLKLMAQIISSRVRVTKRTVNSWFKADTYMNVDKARTIGLVNG